MTYSNKILLALTILASMLSAVDISPAIALDIPCEQDPECYACGPEPSLSLCTSDGLVISKSQLKKMGSAPIEFVKNDVAVVGGKQYKKIWMCHAGGYSEASHECKFMLIPDMGKISRSKPAAVCGDGKAETDNGEMCDPKDQASHISQFCQDDCKGYKAYCGDGVKNGSEQCDESDAKKCKDCKIVMPPLNVVNNTTTTPAVNAQFKIDTTTFTKVQDPYANISRTPTTTRNRSDVPISVATKDGTTTVISSGEEDKRRTPTTTNTTDTTRPIIPAKTEDPVRITTTEKSDNSNRTGTTTITDNTRSTKETSDAENTSRSKSGESRPDKGTEQTVYRYTGTVAPTVTSVKKDAVESEIQPRHTDKNEVIGSHQSNDARNINSAAPIEDKREASLPTPQTRNTEKDVPADTNSKRPGEVMGTGVKNEGNREEAINLNINKDILAKNEIRKTENKTSDRAVPTQGTESRQADDAPRMAETNGLSSVNISGEPRREANPNIGVKRGGDVQAEIPGSRNISKTGTDVNININIDSENRNKNSIDNNIRQVVNINSGDKNNDGSRKVEDQKRGTSTEERDAGVKTAEPVRPTETIRETEIVAKIPSPVRPTEKLRIPDIVDKRIASEVTCGNGRLDAGERCDEGSVNGEPTRCNTTCDGLTPAVRDEENQDKKSMPAIRDLSGIRKVDAKSAEETSTEKVAQDERTVNTDKKEVEPIEKRPIGQKKGEYDRGDEMCAHEEKRQNITCMGYEKISENGACVQCFDEQSHEVLSVTGEGCDKVNTVASDGENLYFSMSDEIFIVSPDNEGSVVAQIPYKGLKSMNAVDRGILVLEDAEGLSVLNARNRSTKSLLALNNIKFVKTDEKGIAYFADKEFLYNLDVKNVANGVQSPLNKMARMGNMNPTAILPHRGKLIIADAIQSELKSLNVNGMKGGSYPIDLTADNEVSQDIRSISSMSLRYSTHEILYVDNQGGVGAMPAELSAAQNAVKPASKFFMEKQPRVAALTVVPDICPPEKPIQISLAKKKPADIRETPDEKKVPTDLTVENKDISLRDPYADKKEISLTKDAEVKKEAPDTVEENIVKDAEIRKEDPQTNKEDPNTDIIKEVITDPKITDPLVIMPDIGDSVEQELPSLDKVATEDDTVTADDAVAANDNPANEAPITSESACKAGGGEVVHFAVSERLKADTGNLTDEEGNVFIKDVNGNFIARCVTGVGGVSFAGGGCSLRL